jgi:hypothetical protein
VALASRPAEDAAGGAVAAASVAAGVASAGVVPPAGGAPTAPAVPAAAAVPRSWRDRWSAGDRATLVLLFGCLALIAAAPLVTAQTWGEARATLAKELHPFPQKQD